MIPDFPTHPNNVCTKTDSKNTSRHTTHNVLCRLMRTSHHPVQNWNGGPTTAKLNTSGRRAHIRIGAGRRTDKETSLTSFSNHNVAILVNHHSLMFATVPTISTTLTCAQWGGIREVRKRKGWGLHVFFGAVPSIHFHYENRCNTCRFWYRLIQWAKTTMVFYLFFYKLHVCTWRFHRLGQEVDRPA